MKEDSMNQKRILLVDDDPDLRLSLRLPLESAGYKVVEACNFGEGQEKVKEFQPDLIILDVMMDTTTAGFQFALEIHSPDPGSEFKEMRETPILMLTAIHSTTPLRFAPDDDYLPVQKFLEKPVDPDVLLDTVGELLAGE
jgi:CheY-like chemotaxis protein